MVTVKNKQPAGLKPGIYFNLHNDAYHADPALSHSGMTKLLISYRDYWVHSPLNPDRPVWKKPKQGSAMWYGSMSHALLLEKSRFWRTYKVVGMSHQGNSSDYQWIGRDEYRELKAAIDEIREVPSAMALFEQGYPEVSIFWRCRVTGIMCRIRVDWLRHFGGIDYKRCRSTLNTQLGYQIAEHGLDLQDAFYREGIAEIKELLRTKKAVVEGDVDAEWLKAFIADEDALFRFFFQRSEAPYIFKVKYFDDDISSNARARIDDAKHLYKDSIARYGIEKPPAGTCEAEEFSIYHLPKRIFD